jgi:hypothetical protein
MNPTLEEIAGLTPTAPVPDMDEFAPFVICGPDNFTIAPPFFGRGLCFDCEDPIEWPPGTPMRPRKICRRCAQVEFLQADLGYRR